MQNTRVASRTVLSLLCAYGILGGHAAQADETIIRETVNTPYTIVSPTQTFIAPATDQTTTTTTRTTVTDDAPADQVIERRTVMFPTNTIGSSNSSSSTTIDTNALQNGTPDYGRRIHNLKSQLDKAIANGWISNEEAQSLNSQCSELVSDEQNVRNNGYIKADCDAFEKKLNAFNIRLSDDMARSNHM